ncbi:hypothetical protein Dimus_011418, partial [Dionaea muscipula]
QRGQQALSRPRARGQFLVAQLRPGELRDHPPPCRQGATRGYRAYAASGSTSSRGQSSCNHHAATKLPIAMRPSPCPQPCNLQDTRGQHSSVQHCPQPCVRAGSAAGSSRLHAREQ